MINEVKSNIHYNYTTLRLTKSRINKGLIAIPRSMIDWFPNYSREIEVYLDDSSLSERKKYSSFIDSSTRESRIGGMKGWFEKHNMHDGDDIIIQLIDKMNFKYRIISENYFVIKTFDLETKFDNSENEDEAINKIITLSEWVDVHRKEVVINEYRRLVETIPIHKRTHSVHTAKQRNSVSPHIKILLEEIYHGHCQVCFFSFLKKDYRPYFEIHHIDPERGDYPKNLVAVCANCHRQFTYARLNQKFNEDGWLINISFNDSEFSINQIFLNVEFEGFKKQQIISD